MMRRIPAVPMIFGAVIATLGGLGSLPLPTAYAGTGVGLPPGDPPAGKILPGVEIGTLGGVVKVGAYGGLGWSVPLNVPEGPGTSAPELTISYNGGGYGGMGVGFSLHAGSAIARCHKTYGRDGENAPLTWTTADALCMGGVRLVRYSGTYGMDEAEYRPETSPTSRIIQHGNSTQPDSGFTVYLPDGSTTEYGTLKDTGEQDATVNARIKGHDIPLSWHIKRYIDVAKNRREYRYASEVQDGDNTIINQDHRLTALSYGANDKAAVTNATRTITFGYDTIELILGVPKVTVQQGFTAGARYQQTRMLTRVQMNVGGKAVRHYRMDYERVPEVIDAGAGDRVRLHQLEECSGNDECFPPTTFEWSVGAKQYASMEGFAFDGVPFYPLPKASELNTAPYLRADNTVMADFDGDGDLDFMVSPVWMNQPDESIASSEVWEFWRMDETEHAPLKTHIPALSETQWVNRAGTQAQPDQQIFGSIDSMYFPIKASMPARVGHGRDSKAVQNSWAINENGTGGMDLLIGSPQRELAGAGMDPPAGAGSYTVISRSCQTSVKPFKDMELLDQIECLAQVLGGGVMGDNPADYRGHPGIMSGFSVYAWNTKTQDFEKKDLGYPVGRPAMWASPQDVNGDGLTDLVFCKADEDYSKAAYQDMPMFYGPKDDPKNWLSGEVYYALNQPVKGLDLSDGGQLAQPDSPIPCHLKDSLSSIDLYGDGRTEVLHVMHGHAKQKQLNGIDISVPADQQQDPYPYDPDDATLNSYTQKIQEKLWGEMPVDQMVYSAFVYEKDQGLVYRQTGVPFDLFMRWQMHPGNKLSRYSLFRMSDANDVDGGYQSWDMVRGAMTDWGSPTSLLVGGGESEMRHGDVNGDGLTDIVQVGLEESQCYYQTNKPNQYNWPIYATRTCTFQDIVEFGTSLNEQTYEKLALKTYINRGDGTFELRDKVTLWDTDLRDSQYGSAKHHGDLLFGLVGWQSEEDVKAFGEAWNWATSATRSWRAEFGNSALGDVNGDGLADFSYAMLDFKPQAKSWIGESMDGMYTLKPMWLRSRSTGVFDKVLETMDIDLNSLVPGAAEHGWPMWQRESGKNRTNWQSFDNYIANSSVYEAQERGLGTRYILTDANHDGIDDFLIFDHVRGRWEFGRGLASSQSQTGGVLKGTADPNLLTAVVDGMKARTEIDYAPQWTLPATGTQWSEADINLPYPLFRRPSTAWVVKEVRSDTGSDISDHPDYTAVRYRYGKTTADFMRGATIGIDKRETRSDEVTSSGTVHTQRMERYDTSGGFEDKYNAYPLAGSLIAQTTMVWQDGGVDEPVYLTHEGRAYSPQPGVASGTWRVQVDASTTTSFEIDPEANPGAQKVYECLMEAFDGASECVLGNPQTYQPLTSAQTVTVYDNYGYPLVSQVKSGGATKLTTVPEYLHQDTLLFENYALGLPKETSVANEAYPGGGFTVHTTAFEYYPDGRLKRRTIEPNKPDYRHGEETFYDAFGNVSKTTLHAEGEPDSWVFYDYTPSGVYLEKTQNALGLYTTTTWNEACGVPLQQTNTLKQTMVSDYDTFCRPKGSRSYYGNVPLSPQVTIDYAEYKPDANEAYKDVEMIATTAIEGGVKSYTLTDRTGKQYLTQGPGFGFEAYMQSVHDRLGREVRTSPPTKAGQNPVGWNEATLDARGRVRVLTHVDGSTRTTAYRRYDDTKDGLVFRNGIPIACDECTATSLTDELGYTGTSITDALGQIVKVIPPKEEEPGALDTSMCYSYGAFGVLTTAEPCTPTPDKGATTFQYDLYGRLTQSEDKQGGKRRMFYDSVGQIDYTVDAKGIKTKLRFDVLGRQIERIEDWQGTSPKSATWTYDPELGVLVEAKNADGTVVEHTHMDQYHRPSGGEIVIHGRSYKTFHGYNARGLQDATYYPTLDPQQQVKTTTLYNDKDQVIGMTYGDKVLWEPLEADVFGHTTRQGYGNGLFARSEYDPLNGRLNEATVYRNKYINADLYVEEPVQTHTYDWYNNGSLRMRVKKSLVQDQNDQADQFYYTPRGELKGWTTIGAGKLVQQNAMSFDGFGNIKSGPPGEYTYVNEQLQQVKGANRVVSYQYDANGNVTLRSDSQSSDTALKYNAVGRVESIADKQGLLNVTYSAGGEKVHVWNTLTGEETTYVGPYQETRGGSLGAKIVSRYNLGVAHLVRTWDSATDPMQYTDDPLTYLTPADHLGSLTLVTTDTGTIKEERSYDTWGASRDASDFLKAKTVPKDPKQVNVGYTGHEYQTFGGNGGNGLIDMKARYYDPVTYRMMQTDSMIPDVMQPLALNRYTYNYNSPVSFVDTTGHAPQGQNSDDEPQIDWEARAKQSMIDALSGMQEMVNAYNAKNGFVGLPTGGGVLAADTMGVMKRTKPGGAQMVQVKLKRSLDKMSVGEMNPQEKMVYQDYQRDKANYELCKNAGTCKSAPFTNIDEYIQWRLQSYAAEGMLINNVMMDEMANRADEAAGVVGFGDKSPLKGGAKKGFGAASTGGGGGGSKWYNPLSWELPGTKRARAAREEQEKLVGDFEKAESTGNLHIVRSTDGKLMLHSYGEAVGEIFTFKNNTPILLIDGKYATHANLISAWEVFSQTMSGRGSRMEIHFNFGESLEGATTFAGRIPSLNRRDGNMRTSAAQRGIFIQTYTLDSGLRNHSLIIFEDLEPK